VSLALCELNIVDHYLQNFTFEFPYDGLKLFIDPDTHSQDNICPILVFTEERSGFEEAVAQVLKRIINCRLVPHEIFHVYGNIFFLGMNVGLEQCGEYLLFVLEILINSALGNMRKLDDI